MVINANTVFNGDATIVSQGKDETTIIEGGKITFTRGGYPITVIRNVQVGEIETNSDGKGFLYFPKFKDMSLMLSIKSFNISQNIRSLGCYANLVNSAENKYQVFLYGKESGLSEGTAWTSPLNSLISTYTVNCIGINLSGIRLFKERVNFTMTRDSVHTPQYASIGLVTPPKVYYKIIFMDDSKTQTIKTGEMVMMKELTGTHFNDTGSDPPRFECYTYFDIYLDSYIPINFSNTSFNLTNMKLKVELSVPRQKMWGISWRSGYYEHGCSVSMTGTYSLEKLDNLVGNGTLFYMAIEN